MRDNRLLWRLPPLAVFVGTVAVWAIMSLPDCVHVPGLMGVPERKFMNCFVNWWAFWTIVALAAASFVLGWPAFRRAMSETTARGSWVFFTAMAMVAIWIGAGLFETGMFSHSMLRWRYYDYLQVMGWNALVCFVPTAFVIFLLRPWKLAVSAGWLRTTCLAMSLMLLNYILAFLAYKEFPICLIE